MPTLTVYKRASTAANAVNPFRNFFKISPPLRRSINLPRDGEIIMTILLIIGINWDYLLQLRCLRPKMP